MKFGKQLRAEQNFNWLGGYVDYKELKKAVKQFAAVACAGSCLCQPIPAEDIVGKFVQLLVVQLDRINEFFVTIQAMLVADWDAVHGQWTHQPVRNVLRSDRTTVSARHPDDTKWIELATAAVNKEFCQLQNLVKLNSLAFTKIIKKFEKQTGHSLNSARSQNWYQLLKDAKFSDSTAIDQTLLDIELWLYDHVASKKRDKVHDRSNTELPPKQKDARIVSVKQNAKSAGANKRVTTPESVKLLRRHWRNTRIRLEQRQRTEAMQGCVPNTIYPTTLKFAKGEVQLHSQHLGMTTVAGSVATLWAGKSELRCQLNPKLMAAQQRLALCLLAPLGSDGCRRRLGADDESRGRKSSATVLGYIFWLHLEKDPAWRQKMVAYRERKGPRSPSISPAVSRPCSFDQEQEDAQIASDANEHGSQGTSVEEEADPKVSVLMGLRPL